MCQLPEELGVMFRDATVGGPPDFPPGSPSGEDRLQEDGGSQDGVLLQDGMDAQPSDPSAAISGDSDILLCASAEISGCDLEPSLEVKEGALLDELVSARPPWQDT